MSITTKIKAIRLGLVADVPPAYQACEACRVTDCNSAKYESCLERRLGEEQETKKRAEHEG